MQSAIEPTLSYPSDSQAEEKAQVKRLSIDCKAMVNVGEYSRDGMSRVDTVTLDHDMGCQEKLTPFGIVDEDTGELTLTFGSSHKTSDFIASYLN